MFNSPLLDRKYFLLASLAVAMVGTGCIWNWHTSAQTRGSRRIAVAAVPESTSAAGDLDTTFLATDASVPAGVSRIFYGMNSAAQTDIAKAIDFQTVGGNAGKIIVLGTTQVSNLDEAVVRLNTNGSVDGAFASGGRVQTDYSGSFSNKAIDVAVVPGSDKIVVVGTASVPDVQNGLGCLTSNDDMTVTVYNADGTLDGTFNGSGKKTINVFDCGDSADAVVIEPNLVDPTLSKIVILGEAQKVNAGLTDTYLTLTRLTMTGAPDTTLNAGVVANLSGTVTHLESPTSVGPGRDIARITTGTQAGKFIVAGFTPSFSNGMIARFNSNGSLDNAAGTGFGTGNGGFINVDFAGNNDAFVSVAIQSDGKVVAAGTANFNTANPDFFIARTTEAGLLDPTFDGDGKQRIDILPALAGSGAVSSNDAGNRVDIMSNGLIVVSGQANGDNGPNNNAAIIRLNRLGGLDATFSGDGIVATKLSGNVANAPSANTGALQPDGKILVGGNIGSEVNSVSPDMFVARFLNTISTAANVSVSGRVETSDGRGLTNAHVTITGSDGSSTVVVTGRNGRFEFSNLEAGKNYIISVGSMRFNYEPRPIFVTDNVSGIIFAPE